MAVHLLSYEFDFVSLLCVRRPRCIRAAQSRETVRTFERWTTCFMAKVRCTPSAHRLLVHFGCSPRFAGRRAAEDKIHRFEALMNRYEMFIV